MLSLPGLVFMAGGLLLVYVGVEDPAGGPVGALKSVFAGEIPTPGAQVRTATTGTDSGQGRLIGKSSAGSSATFGTGGGSADRSKIIATAQTYLGVPYVWAGASRSGVDCSGLVLLAYKAVGISLPHKATLQAARGRRISRASIKPGDLVAWGAPGNYPHIALAMDQDTVIVAPHTGSHVMYQKLWQKKVGGYGYPDIYRILGD